MAAVASPFYLSFVKTNYLLDRVNEARQIPNIEQSDLDQLGSDLLNVQKEIQIFMKSGSPFTPQAVKKVVASFRARLYALIPAETEEEKIHKKTQFFHKYAHKLNIECAQSRLQRYATSISSLRSQPHCNIPVLILATKVIIAADEKLRRMQEQALLEDRVKISWGQDAISLLPQTKIPIFANTYLHDQDTRMTAILHFLIASMQGESPSCLLRVIEKGKRTVESLKKQPQADVLTAPDFSCLERLLPQSILLAGGDRKDAFCSALEELESHGKANQLFIISGIFMSGTESFGVVLNYGRMAKLVGIFDPCGYTEVRPETDKLSAYFIAFKDIKDTAEFLARRFADQPAHLSGQLLPLHLKEKSKTRLNFQSVAIPGTAPRPAARRSLASYLRIAHIAADSVRSRQGKSLSDFLQAAKLAPDYARQTPRGVTLSELYYRLDALRGAVLTQDKAAIKKAFELLSESPLPSTIRKGNISDYLYEQLFLSYKAIWESNPALPDPHQQAFNNQFGKLAFHSETDIAIDPKLKLSVIDKVKKALKSNWRI